LFYHAFFESPVPSAPEIVTPGDGLHDFRAETQAGDPVHLADFLGRPTVVYFWTSWCPWCTRGLAELELLYEEVGDTVQILVVNLPHLGRRPNELESGRALMAEGGFSFPSLYDVHGEAQAAYGISGVPMALFIDAEGRLVHHQLGFMDAEALLHTVAQFH